MKSLMLGMALLLSFGWGMPTTTSPIISSSTSLIMTDTTIDKRVISSAFPYASNYLQVRGANLHYIDEGAKTAEHTFLLLHGNPTSSYIWRNIIPYLTPHGRVIAPDLIGMGKSDKPDIDYTYEQHIGYIDDFISQLQLDNIVLVIQGWGSGIGFHYAHRFPEKVVGIAFLEAIVRPIEWSDANFIERFILDRKSVV